MSQAWLRVGGVVLILVTLVSLGKARTDASPQSTAPALRVAVVNLAFVFKNMNECKTFQAERVAVYKVYEKLAKDLQAQQVAATKRLSDSNLLPEKREEIEREVNRIKRKLEDLNDEAKHAVTREDSKEMVALYTRIRKVAESYAKAHGIDLVLNYQDAPASAELDSPAVVTRKLQSTGCVPLYTAPGIDISKEVLAEVNAKGTSEDRE
jgi:Skp family chaperone for outer membrane proteins